jgi:uncharacterized RDD family membrane protein YckC
MNTPEIDRGLVLAGLGRRLLCLCYEAVLAFALLMTVFLLEVPVLYGLSLLGLQAADYQQRWVGQLNWLFMLAILYGYFALCWCRTGQTLPMKTWRLQLVRADGRMMNREQALLRFTLALFGTLFFGAGLIWALLDRDGQFLHDRLAGTFVIRLPV